MSGSTPLQQECINTEHLYQTICQVSMNVLSLMCCSLALALTKLLFIVQLWVSSQRQRHYGTTLKSFTHSTYKAYHINLSIIITEQNQCINASHKGFTKGLIWDQYIMHRQLKPQLNGIHCQEPLASRCQQSLIYFLIPALSLFIHHG